MSTQRRGSGTHFEVQAAFSDNMQGVITPVSCLVEGLCLVGFDSDVDVMVPTPTPPEGFRDATFRYVAPTLQITENLAVPFVNRDGVAGYVHQGPALDEPLLSLTELNGEWGRFALSWPTVTPMTVLEPAPGTDVGSTESVVFRWEPGGQPDELVVLTVTDGGQSFVGVLQDDGRFELNLPALGLAPGARPTLTLGRWLVQALDAPYGNRITLVASDSVAYQGRECVDYPQVNIGPAGPIGPAIDPYYVALDYDLVVDGNRIEDFWLDQGFGRQAFPSYARFHFYDQDFNYVCDILYEADNATPQAVGGLSTDSGGGLYSMWQLDLVDGLSTCGLVDPGVFGSADLRDFLLLFPWSVGVGERVAIDPSLAQAFGADWSVFDPLAAAQYISFDGNLALEVGGSFHMGMESCGTVDANQTLLVAVTGPITSGRHQSTAVLALGIR